MGDVERRMIYLFLLAFIFFYAILFAALLHDQQSRFEEEANRSALYIFGLGLLFGAVNAIGLRLLAGDQSAYLVATSGFVLTYSLAAGVAIAERLLAEHSSSRRRLLLGAALGLIGGLVAVLVLVTVLPGNIDPFYLFLAGFAYVYMLVFGGMNISEVENRQPTDASLPTLYLAGLLAAAVNGLVLWGMWASGLPPAFVGIAGLILTYTLVAGDGLLEGFFPTAHPTVRDDLRGAAVGLVLGLVVLATLRALALTQADSLFVTGLGIYCLYTIILGGMVAEPVFIARRQPVKYGAILGGVYGFGLGLLSLVVAFGVDFSGLGTDVVGAAGGIDASTIIEYLAAAVVALGLVTVGLYLLKWALHLSVPQGQYLARNVERSFVFYQFSSFLMGPFELLLTPVQQKLGIDRMAYFFIMPNMLIFGIFVLAPMLLNFYFGLTVGNSILPENRWASSGQQLTTANLERILDCEDVLTMQDGDPWTLDFGIDPNKCREDRFWRAVRNTFFYVIFQVSSMVAFALITALALNRNIRYRGFFRSVFFYPVLLSPVVVALIWRWVLDFDSGILNGLLESLGTERIRFIANRENVNWPRFWVIVVADWAFMGFYTLILLAGLQSIPGTLYEAAQIDGANPWDQFRHVTLPLLMPTMTVVIVLALIRAVQVFDQVFVLTGGGPGSATLYMVQYIYQAAFNTSPPNFGLASAASLLLASVLFVATLAQLYLARRSEAV